MRQLLSCLLGACFLLPGQPAVFLSPSPSNVKNHLELTDAQFETLQRVNQRFKDLAAAKAARTAQVEAEIQHELAQPVIDAGALGVRYRELELIRREVAAEQERTRSEAVGMLTTAQKPKLAVLQEALVLQYVACSAAELNLLVPPLVLLGYPANSLTTITGGLRGPCPGSPTATPILIPGPPR